MLVRKTAMDDIQAETVGADGEAQAIRATGDAKAQTYTAGVAALGAQGYAALQLMQIVGARGVRVVPDVAVSGKGDGTDTTKRG